jgi:hypothetical protein
MKILVLLAVVAVGVAGCVYIDGPTTTLIDQSAALSKQVAANATGRSDAASWQGFSDTAHGVKTGGGN